MIYTVENTIEVDKPVKVFVDGVRVMYAFFADTDAGIVKRYTYPFSRSGDGYANTITITGKVTVKPIK